MNLRLHAAALLFATSAVHAQAQTTFTDAGSYSTTTDKISIGSTATPTRELEVFGKAVVTGDLLIGGTTNNVYGRFMQITPNWLGMTLNTTFNGVANNSSWNLDDTSMPAWMFKLDSRPNYDGFLVARLPNGSNARPDTAWVPMFGIGPTGNVGIDMGWTWTAQARLEVRGPATNAGGPERRLVKLWDDTAMALGVGPGIALAGKHNTAGDYAEFANIKGVKLNGTTGDSSGNLVLMVRTSSDTDEVVRISKPNTSLPGAVWIDADVTVTGNLAAKYQDVAEWVPAIGKLDAGTVVVIAPEHRNAVMASSEAYDSSVAGVVSAQPGLTLGEAGADKVMVATTGRVKIKVDATRAPIRAGDLLVTSGRSGMAMKSEAVDVAGVKFHRPGTVVGKALEPLAGGTGEILVLLSLQ